MVGEDWKTYLFKEEQGRIFFKEEQGPCQAPNSPTFGYLTIGAWPRLLDSLDEAFRGVY